MLRTLASALSAAATVFLPYYVLKMLDYHR
jgi:hypothetical protein